LTPYALANHVFVCLQDEHVVFLDVRNDRYFALEAARTRGLDTLVRGWPVPGESGFDAKQDLLESGLLDVLRSRGLLTDAQRAGKDATPIQCTPPVDEIEADETSEPPKIGAAALSRFLRAAAVASVSLRFMPFERVVRGAQWRRAHAHATTGASALSRELAQRLIAVFAWLRPYAFTTRDACLFEALALGRFLASYKIYPRWIFGVQARPFAAHCWLQHEEVVLNDTVEHVSRYTPIMIV
jgi:hypothetical protein